jgi:phosphoribosyl 1,2-cyclic phosphodiesterase
VIADQMQNTYFPVPLETMKANLHFQNWQEGKYKVSEAEVETLFLHHPGNCLGFRASLRGKSMVYLCDNELTDNQAEFRTRLRTFLNKTDLLVADAQYTPADFPAKRGWGHSLYTDVVDIAMDAKVRRLALTHHDPDRNDDALDAIVADSRRRIAERGMHMECFAAQEGSAVFL